MVDTKYLVEKLGITEEEASYMVKHWAYWRKRVQRFLHKDRRR